MTEATSQYNLSVVNPKLAKEWHPSKNGKLTPYDVTPKSHKKVWWQCRKIHEWQSTSLNRSNGSNCPYCAGKKATKETCLSAVNPKLADEWHPTKNGSLTPEDVMLFSDKKVWWHCKKGHEWVGRVASRSQGSGCPFCSNRRVCKDNCLTAVNSQLASEWHPTKNGTLAPEDITSGSQEKVWWQCKRNHEWQSTVKNRTKGCGCPYCANKKVCRDNCLATVNPKLASEWHPTKNGKLTPEDIVPGTHKKVWWQCKKGHEWQAIPVHRSNGSGCPYCSNCNKKVCKDNCLATVNPRLASDWHPTKNGALTPEHLTPSSGKKVWWLCKRGHEWKVSPNGRYAGQKCPYCSNRKACQDNCLTTVNPKLASEWHPTKNGVLTPDKVTPGSGKEIWWQCKRGHEWKADVGSRSRGYGCPLCYFQISSVELRIYTELKCIFDDIKQKEKIGGKECDIYIPSLRAGIEYDGEYWHRNKLYKDSEKNLFFKKRGITLIRIRELPLSKIAQHDIQYNYSHDDKLNLIKIILKRFQETLYLDESLIEKIDIYLERKNFANNKHFQELQELLPSPPVAKSLAILNPSLASEWHPSKNGKLTPEDVTLKSGEKIWWQCKRGHEWKTTPNSRSSGGSCPYCGNRKVCKENCLATVSPKIASQWHPTKNGTLTPEDVLPFSNKKVWWQCKKGHEWHVAPNGRSRGNNCPCCAGQRVTKETSLAAKNPQLAREWHPTKNGALSPEDVTHGSNKNVWWVCKKGHEWGATVGDRTNGNGCPYCSRRKSCKDNCLATVNSQLAKEWHPTKNGPLTSEDITPGSGKKVWWICKQGHEWEAVVAKRSGGLGCPYCSNKKVCKDNCLGTVNPKIAKEWHPTKNGKLTTEDVISGSHKKAWWQCDKGHEWVALVKDRSNGSGCPYCSNKKVCKDNCLATVNPKLAGEWHPTKNGKLTPENVTSGSHKKVWWQCKRGHEWKTTVDHRNRGRCCPCCVGRKSNSKQLALL